MSKQASDMPHKQWLADDWPGILQFLTQPRNLRTRLVSGAIILVAISSTLFLDAKMGNQIDTNFLYALIVLTAFVLFKVHGIWWLILILFSNHVNLLIYPHHVSLRLETVDDFLTLSAFGMTGLMGAWVVNQLVVLQKNHRSMQRNLKLAADTQLQMLPAPLKLPWVSLSGRLEPAAEVGGDFYLIEPITANKIFFGIGDVEGKGIAAALTMMKTMTIFSDLAKQNITPGELLHQVNERIAADNSPTVSAFIGYVSLQEDGSLSLDYAKAGHENALLFDKHGVCTELSAEGLILGAASSEHFQDYSLELAPGNRLLFYTDGLVDARDAHLKPFGTIKLVRWASAHARNTQLQDIDLWLMGVLEEVNKHLGGKPQQDDITLLGIAVSKP